MGERLRAEQISNEQLTALYDERDALRVAVDRAERTITDAANMTDALARRLGRGRG